jgi:hypothetical protein
MKTKLLFTGILSLALVFGLTFIACDGGGDTPDNGYIEGGLIVTPTAEGFELTIVKSKIPAGTTEFGLFCDSSTYQYLGRTDPEDGSDQKVLYNLVRPGEHTFHIEYTPSGKRTPDVKATTTGGAGNKDDFKVKVKQNGENPIAITNPRSDLLELNGDTIKLKTEFELDLTDFDGNFDGTTTPKFTEKSYCYDIFDDTGWIGWGQSANPSLDLSNPGSDESNRYYVLRGPVGTVRFAMSYSVVCGGKNYQYLFAQIDNIQTGKIPSDAVGNTW